MDARLREVDTVRGDAATRFEGSSSPHASSLITSSLQVMYRVLTSNLGRFTCCMTPYSILHVAPHSDMHIAHRPTP
jgi:hypothetical protein